jgi:hypothetical protein
MNMGSEMTNTLWRHDVEKCSITISHVQALFATAKGIGLDHILGGGTVSSIHAHGLAIFRPPFHSAKQISQGVIDDWNEASDVLVREVWVQHGAATSMKIMVARCEHTTIGLQDVENGVEALAAVLWGLGVNLVNKCWVVYVNSIRSGSDDRTIFLVHFLNNPDVLPTFDKVVVCIIP